jgi:hypothetical protein
VLIPGNIEPETFFLAVDSDSGEIYCAHQEFVAISEEGQAYLTPSPAAENFVLDIAAKANPMALAARDRLRVVRIMTDPTINFSRYRVDLQRNELVEREAAEASATDASIAFRDDSPGQ